MKAKSFLDDTRSWDELDKVININTPWRRMIKAPLIYIQFLIIRRHPYLLITYLQDMNITQNISELIGNNSPLFQTTDSLLPQSWSPDWLQLLHHILESLPSKSLLSFLLGKLSPQKVCLQLRDFFRSTDRICAVKCVFLDWRVLPRSLRRIQ